MWHMPSRSVHRRHCPLRPQLLVVAQAVVAGQAAGEVADLAVEPVHRRAARAGSTSSVAIAANSTRPLVIEPVGRSGDRVGVTGRHASRRQRRVHLGHRRAHRGPLGDHLGLA